MGNCPHIEGMGIAEVMRRPAMSEIERDAVVGIAEFDQDQP